MVNLPPLISLTYLASVGLAPHRPSRLFGKLDASRHLTAPCAIAGEAIAVAPLVTARRAKFRREIVMQSLPDPTGGYEPAFLFLTDAGSLSLRQYSNVARWRSVA
jgi:hypothetical protein